MGEVTLDRAIALLSSEKQRERSDGLADLKHILQQNKWCSKLTTLSDKACYKIFDSLFRFILVEKPAYARAQRSNSKGPSGSRLSACASVIRTAVDVLLRNLRARSVRAITYHITDTLSAPGEGLWEPLSVDYTKALAALLHYPPHVEHLGDDEWGTLMKFCLRGLGIHGDDDSQSSLRNGRRSTLDDYFDAGSGRSTPSGMTPTLAIRERHVGDQSVTEEILVCIQLLIASPNAPVQADAEKILRGLGEFVKSASVAGSAHQAAFHSINTVVTKALFDQSTLVRASLLDLIPVIRRLWTTKHTGLKDELLVTSLFCTIILSDATRREPSETLADLVEGLLDTLYSEYTKRPEKETLQLDELVFYQTNSIQLEKPIVRPRLGSTKSEHNWTVVWAVASLLQLTEEMAIRSSVPRTLPEGSFKRQRFTSAVDDIFRDSFSSFGMKRVCALQLIPFLLRGQISPDSKSSLLQRLTPNIADDNASLSSWTMLAIASIACTPDAKTPSLKPCWQRAWDITSRASTSQPASRAACILMSTILQCDLLEYSAFAETSRSMLSSVNLNGPSTISDSSLGFWATMTRMSSQMNPGSIMNASGQICGWLREVWTIGTVTDRIQTAQVAAFARPLDLLNLLLACTNRPFSLPDHLFGGPTGLIGRNWHFCHSNRRLLRYLFHVEEMIESVDPWDAEDIFSIEQSTRPDPNDAVILDLLQSKSEVFLQAWDAMSENKSHHITVDIVQILCSFCIVTALYTECLPQQFAPRLRTLQQNSQQLWRKICSFLGGGESDFYQVVLELISPVLASTKCFSDANCAVSRSLCGLVPPLAEVLESYRQRKREYLSADTEDSMDLDDPLSMNDERLEVHELITNLNREATPLFHDAATFQRCLTIQLSMFQVTQPGGYRFDKPDSEALVGYLTGLDEVDILSAQYFLPQVYHACSGLERESLLNLLEDIGEKCLQSYGLERCESSHSLCIHMMDSFVTSWTNEERDHFSDSASDIYTWFTDVLLANQMASSRVYISLARLLGRVLEFNANYPGDQSSPSPRTCLFTILQQGDLVVKFSAADLIQRLFGRFSLKDHDAIFNDVLESLPRDPDWTEGIALRLFVLAQLASQWHTLLRKSIYHMFETPAQVPHSLWYAEKCLQNVAKTLGLEDPKELFRLFSCQILYTWTETQPVRLMPFRMFGYASLRDMLDDVQDEIVGQTIMRGEEHEMSELPSCMDTPFVDLLSASFYTAEAYSIARDISTPPSQGSQPKGAENRLKRILGADNFVHLLDQQFPLVITTFFRSLDQYDQIERAFAKRANFQGALAILRNITEKSASTVVLPANQQPSFRSRYLLDELDFLCRRTGYELGTIWTPTLASFVCRTLLESIHPALGSLHACSVIQKIRILVSVAGQVILRDYPFEMILHALRPFLTDVYCSEDALGIFWYLLEAGTLHLTENPPFMAGIAVSTLVSLRNFLVSSPERITQDNQFKSVVPNVKRFLRWFEELLDSYAPPSLNSETEASFRRLVKSARNVSTAESASKEATESGLLVEVLRDRNSAQGLLSRPISDHVISLLCTSFKKAPDTQSNVPGADESVSAETVTIFQTLENFDPGTDYRLWAAKIMGRAFAATGNISDALLREQDPSLFDSQDSTSSSAVFNHSKVTILQVLCSMLQNDDRLEVGLVERTLQLIVSNLANSPEFGHCESAIPAPLMNALAWSPYQCPIPRTSNARTGYGAMHWDTSLPSAEWARCIALFLSTTAVEDPVIGPLGRILKAIPGLAERLLPYIVHDVVLAEIEGGEDPRQIISDIFKQALRDVNENTIPHARLVVNCVLYLRNQPLPDESTIVERDEWLDIDYGEASSAASKCRLPKTSLLFLEIHSSRMAAKSRRSSVAKYCPPSDTLHDVFKSIDDPDLFYGVQRASSLNSVMERLEYESSGLKNVLFQNAQYDSDIQLSRDANMYGVVKALNSTNLQGIARSMFSAPGESKDTSASFDSMLQAASSLRQWDIPVSPLNTSPSATVFRAFQCLNTSGTVSEASTSIDECLLTTLNLLGGSSGSATVLRAAMKALGIMTEISDVLCATSLEDIDQEWQTIKTRNSWLRSAGFHEVGEIINWQEALFSSIKQKEYLKSAIGISDCGAQLLEAKVIRQSLDITRSHEIPQASLKSAICLSKLADTCSSLGIDIEGAAKFDLANVLWDQGEMTTSIGMLQQLNDQNDLHKQAIPISRAELLVTLGHNVAEARLEKPEAIIQEYLTPAVKELKGSSEGHEAGRVYHGFAVFCDQQLQNPDGLEDFRRAEQLRDRKEQEVRALEEMMQNAHGKEKDTLRLHRSKTKQWFDLDDREYQRLQRSREAFLQQCLENYLLCLRESDAYNNDALRFCAIWLDKSDSDIANAAVSKHLSQVPSRKFASLMNQLSSRLLDVPDNFQKLLFALNFRICADHPFHGMYQIFASSKSKGGKDQSSMARYRAAGKLAEQLKNDKRIEPTWFAVHNTNINYVRFAMDRPDEKLRSGAKVSLRKLLTGQRLEQDAATQRLPPPTMKIDLRVDCDYSDVTKLVRFQSEFTIASGVSAPKIVTAVGSDGQRYKQLFKGGNDDLRQDAIMEQVFEQVSSLLKDHQATRQRDLGIRTYKVLPLTSNAGIIEFVPNTIPLHDFLMPAHQRYFPKDMKPNVCRKHISDVQTRSFEQRVRTYRQVAEHFRPVMRYFFMEKYNNPDDWFSKRLSYTRSTAAISVLGHVLGLGDRHGHNILLDERTGEVVHIDLGVAFEQGRVLPVPEVVPFRLTRDLVDGMGITKTEGVFRRCCEFTLEALRQESYSIMTILDVLRYDPLYSWTVSPLRMKRMQDPQVAEDGPPVLPGATDKGSANEPSEADRALTVVAKKLSKTLSVTATVNELIQQATDERNLAVLYCGWAAYA